MFQSCFGGNHAGNLSVFLCCNYELGLAVVDLVKDPKSCRIFNKIHYPKIKLSQSNSVSGFERISVGPEFSRIRLRSDKPFGFVEPGGCSRRKGLSCCLNRC